MEMQLSKTDHGSDGEAWLPSSDSERRAVRDELERVLASAFFSGSKRCSSLLRYVVEHTLLNPTESLKESILGVDVFGRPPLYDTDLDNTVRTAAYDVRKRLAQYYVHSGHESRIRIELPPGSYVPEFQSVAEETGTFQAHSQRRRRRLHAILPAIFMLLLLAAAAWVWLQPHPSAVDRFWGPVWAKGSDVLFVVSTFGGQTPGAAPRGDGSAAKSGASGDVFTLMEESELESVPLSDALALARLAGLFQAHGKQWRLKRLSSTLFTDLRESPAVLIGNPRSPLTKRLSDQLRFTVEHDEATNTTWIQDRLNPARRDWKVPIAPRPPQVYALVSRFLDATTNRMVVALAGVTKYGTQAASDFVTSSAYLQAAFPLPHGAQDTKNIQIVITAKLINGTPGPPRLLAVHAW